MTKWVLWAAVFFTLGCGPLPSGLGPNSSAAQPTLSNSSDCPATWGEARQLCAPQSPPCSGFSLRCDYPGAGDQLPDGSWATAVLGCVDTSGTGVGPGVWRCAQ